MARSRRVIVRDAHGPQKDQAEVVFRFQSDPLESGYDPAMLDISGGSPYATFGLQFSRGDIPAVVEAALLATIPEAVLSEMRQAVALCGDMALSAILHEMHSGEGQRQHWAWLEKVLRDKPSAKEFSAYISEVWTGAMKGARWAIETYERRKREAEAEAEDEEVLSLDIEDGKAATAGLGLQEALADIASAVHRPPGDAAEDAALDARARREEAAS